MIFRRLRRAVALGVTIAFCMLRFGLMRLRGPVSMERRGWWGSWASRQVIHAMGIHCRVHGTPATEGLVVANHLSYLDILVLAADMPCFFVAKAEIGSWPLFGTAARMCGTIFIDRGNRQSALSVANQMTQRMQLGIHVPVLMFPEGTSTDGSGVLRFHSRLIDPAVVLGVPITTAAIRYELGNGTPERELCWYGDENFLDHIWKVLGAGHFWADVQFGSTQVYTDRRRAADSTHDEIVTLRSEPVAQLKQA